MATFPPAEGVHDHARVEPAKNTRDCGEWARLEPTSYAHLFWLIPRDDLEEKWNCEVFNIDVTQAHALQHRGSSGTARAIARAFSVAVPALRNTRAIAKGDKVVLKWPKPKAVAKPPRTGTTWISNANEEMKWQKLRHPSEQGGPSR